jgi:fumarate hydratase class II
MMVAMQVVGNDSAIGFAGSQGEFELHVFKPVMIFNLLHSILIMTDSVLMFEKYCVKGIRANKKQIDQYVHHSLMLVTALSPVIGYDKCSQIVKLALEEGISLKKASSKLGMLSESEFDRIVVPEHMTHP